MKGSDALPAGPKEAEILLESYVVEKTLYELEYELNNRPDWIEVPLSVMTALLAPESA